MKFTAHPLVTTGIALVGAGLMVGAPAASTLAAPDASAPRTVEADVTLASWEYVSWKNLNDPSETSDQKLVEVGFKRVVEQLAQAPFIPFATAANIVTGDKAGLVDIGKNIIDTPLYVSDPVLVLADRNNLLGDETAQSLHNKAWEDRQKPTEMLRDALGATEHDKNEAFGAAKLLALNPIADAPGKIKAALSDPGATLDGLGTAANAAFDKRVAKTEKSLSHAKDRINKVTSALKDDGPVAAVKQIGTNIKDRLDRVKKDIKNGQTTARNAP